MRRFQWDTWLPVGTCLGVREDDNSCGAGDGAGDVGVVQAWEDFRAAFRSDSLVSDVAGGGAGSVADAVEVILPEVVRAGGGFAVRPGPSVLDNMADINRQIIFDLQPPVRIVDGLGPADGSPNLESDLVLRRSPMQRRAGQMLLGGGGGSSGVTAGGGGSSVVGGGSANVGLGALDPRLKQTLTYVAGAAGLAGLAWLLLKGGKPAAKRAAARRRVTITDAA